MAHLVLDEGRDALTVSWGGALLCRYRHGGHLPKPYLHPLHVPGGPDLLEDAPGDHPHHHGLWFGHGRVEEAQGGSHDLWLERPGCGRIAHDGLVLLPDGWEARGLWLAPDGRPLARDRRTFRLTVEADRVTLALDYRLEGPGIRLRGTNEAGLPHLRPAPWIAARGGGGAVDAEGRGGEAGIFGQAAAWVDYSGSWEGTRYGLRVHDHPENPGHPTRWFVRDYGPFSPNDGFFDAAPVALPIRRRYTVTAYRGERP